VGFFYQGKKADTGLASGYSIELLHQQQCNVCPLNSDENLRRCRHPHMEPTGSKRPLVYMLGEAPGKKEDENGEQFIGVSGRVLRPKIPADWIDHIRWNNCVRTRPPDNRDPSDVEIECCRPSIVEDIVRTKPKAIFGFGAVPLRWALGISGKIARITLWAGRRVPINVGGHACWFFPMLHPAYILYSRESEPEQEFKFALDLHNAFELVEKLPDPVVHDTVHIADDVEIVDDDHRKVIDYLNEASQQPLGGVDYETDALRPFNEGSILSAAVSTKQRTFAFPYQHPESVWTEPQLDQIDIAWKRFLMSPCKKISHHLPFELEWSCDRFGRDVLWQAWEDTESQGYILDERRGALSLEFLCLQYFGFNLKAVSNVDRLNLAKTPLDVVLRYNGLDALYHRHLFVAQRDQLKQEGLLDVYEHQRNRVPAVVDEQLKGLPVDQAISRKFFKDLQRELDKIQIKLDALPEVKRFEKMKGRPYKPLSPQDAGVMFRKVMSRDIKSTNEKAITEIKHPVARLTIAFRKANKLRSTYVKPLMKGSPHLFSDDRLHPIINVTSTRTWRSSGEDPNVQNFPIRAGKGIEVRSQVSVDDNHWIVKFDFAGIQARNIAMESKDAALIKAYWNRYDVHTDWMEQLVRLAPRWFEGDRKDKDNVKEHRNRAKNEFVFPSFFGAQPPSIARSLGVDLRIAQAMQDRLWDKFPDIHAWQEGLKKFYREHGYITGLTGFRRRAPITPNEIINSPIQADESMIMFDAMQRISRRGLAASMEIHDDLTFIWHKKQVEANAEIVIEEMIKHNIPWTKCVPLGVEMSIGRNWSKMTPSGEFSSDSWKGDDPNRGSWSDGTGWVAVAKETK
jgi:uracil-DNA glycosylase family 4